VKALVREEDRRPVGQSGSQGSNGPPDAGSPAAIDAFDAFVASFGHDLWRALIPLVGPERARDAAADALSYAWTRWDRVAAMANPRGYVYVTARRYALARPAPSPLLPVPPASELPSFEPRLLDALRELSEMQRTVVYLVEGCGWRLTDAAALLDISVSTLRNHLARGMDRLRARLDPMPDQEGES
jgi:DNA-directed RNA polymerase specialized sigma24 family protein